MQAAHSNELCHLYSAERLQLKSLCRAWQVSPLRVTADLFSPPSDERKWQTLAGRPDPPAFLIYSAWRWVLIFARGLSSGSCVATAAGGQAGICGEKGGK